MIHAAGRRPGDPPSRPETSGTRLVDRRPCVSTNQKLWEKKPGGALARATTEERLTKRQIIQKEQYSHWSRRGSRQRILDFWGGKNPDWKPHFLSGRRAARGARREGAGQLIVAAPLRVASERLVLLFSKKEARPLSPLHCPGSNLICFFFPGLPPVRCFWRPPLSGIDCAAAAAAVSKSSGWILLRQQQQAP
jgi:hypothetical protein